MRVPKVSILIPVYNVEKYLEKCLDSVVNQTLCDIEIICINDGSTDASVKILEKYAVLDSRVHIIHKKNTGYGNSMNIGINAAKGEYIGIIESDDFAELDMFEKLYSLAVKDQLDIARSEFYFYENSDETNTKSDNSHVPHGIVFKPSNEQSVFYQQPSVWANIYRREFLEENKIRFLETPGASYQDTAFTFKAYLAANRMEMIQNAFLHYRINGNSSSFQSTTKVFCVVDEYNEIKRYLKEHSLWKEYHQLVAHLEYGGYIWNYNRLAEPYRTQFVEKWKEIIKLELDDGSISADRFSYVEMQTVESILTTGVLDAKPVVSIIVPIYNMEKYLEKCLNSLVNQTLKNIEIICVNDGSTDNSQKIIDKFVKTDKRIIAIIKKNGGLSSARNVGLEKVRGIFVGFVDSDDWIEPHMFEKAVNEIGDSDAVIMGTTLVGDALMDHRKSDLRYYSVNYTGKVDLTPEVLLNTHVSAWNKLYRADIINEYKLEFPKGLLYEDYSFFWKYFAFCRTAVFDPTPCYNYFRREGSIMFETMQNGNSRAIEHLLIFNDIILFYQRNKTKLILNNYYINKIFLNCFWFAYLNVPIDMKKKVLHYGTKLVKKNGLYGDPVIDALSSREYKSIDDSGAYLIRIRLLKKIVNTLDRAIGANSEPVRKSIFGYLPSASDSSTNLATTEWVNLHETKFNVAKWSLVYDQFSSDKAINLNFPLGISGTVIFPNLSELIGTGNKIRFYVTLWGCESCILEAVVVYNKRLIAGTSISDGMNLYSISVDCVCDCGTIQVIAINHFTREDFSEQCRIFRIERCI